MKYQVKSREADRGNHSGNADLKPSLVVVVILLKITVFGKLGNTETKANIMAGSANSGWKQRSPRTALSMEKILLVRHCSLEPDLAHIESEGQLDTEYI
jgi:hypothetical protein